MATKSPNEDPKSPTVHESMAAIGLRYTGSQASTNPVSLGSTPASSKKSTPPGLDLELREHIKEITDPLNVFCRGCFEDLQNVNGLGNHIRWRAKCKAWYILDFKSHLNNGLKMPKEEPKSLVKENTKKRKSSPVSKYQTPGGESSEEEVEAVMDTAKRFFCKKCPAMAPTTRPVLGSHLTHFHHLPAVQIEGNEGKNFRCQTCANIFTKKSAYSRHRVECELSSEYVGVIGLLKSELLDNSDQSIGGESSRGTIEDESDNEPIPAMCHFVEGQKILCSVCKSSVADIQLYVRHKLRHLLEDQNNGPSASLKCDLCPSTSFKNCRPLHLQQHLLGHLQRESTRKIDQQEAKMNQLEKEKKKCCRCKKNFKNQCDVMNHKCSKVAKIACDTCNRTFQCLEAMSVHFEVCGVQSDESINVKCKICLITFKNREELIYHEISCVKNYHCKISSEGKELVMSRCVVCSICSKKCNNLEDKSSHERQCLQNFCSMAALE